MRNFMERYKMIQNFDDRLAELLRKDSRFVDEEDNSLIRNEVVNSALKGDKELLVLLSEENEIKIAFFDQVKEHLIFNVNKFINYVQDKNFLSNSYTKFKNQIGLTIDEKFLNERGEVSLVWPFKDCVLEAGMTKEDQKRDEIFFNEILAKDEIDRLLDEKVLTNFKKVTVKSEEPIDAFSRNESGVINENFLIKGNNLMALYTLKKQFAGKIKLIYIDPPYNTQGSADTFTYNNTFNHSTWLTFMKNRLEIAKELMREDGIFALSIDDVELYYIGALMDEIFGRENKIGLVCIRHHPRGRTQSNFFSTVHEYCLFYAKNINYVKENFCFESENKEEIISFIRSREDATPETRPKCYYPIYFNPNTKEITLEKKDENFIEILPENRNGKRTWQLVKESFLEELEEKKIIVKKVKNAYQVYRKLVRQNTNKAKTMWTDPKYDANHHGTELLKKLFDGEKLFSYPKSLFTIIDILKLTTKNDDLILDFFAGSGTTGHAVLALNKEDGGSRQFILVEQLDEHIHVCKKRLHKVLRENVKQKTLVDYNKEENFIIMELKKYNEESIKRIQETKNTDDLLEVWKEMCKKYFLNYDVSIMKFNENKKDFEALSLIEQKKLLFEMLNKNQLYVNFSEMNDSQFNIEEAEKELNKEFYGEK